MKKLALVLLAVLAIAVPASAQTYPDWMKGSQLSGDFLVDARLTEALYFPYSFPETGGNLTWLGNLAGYIEYVDWTVFCLHRWPIGQCISEPLPGYGDGKVFQWNPVAMCYLNIEVLPGGTVAFESITIHPESYSATWAMGCFDVVPGHPIPSFEVTDQCPFMAYELNQSPQAQMKLEVD